MSSTAPVPPQFVRPANPPADLRVSTYDQVSGMLIALLMLIGFCVTTMFLIWLTSQVWIHNVAVPVTLLEEEPGGGGTGGSANDMLEEPPQEEIVEVIEPPIEMTLESIVDVVSTQAAAIDTFRPAQTGTGQRGDGRAIGPGGDGTADIVPRWERWDIRYSTSSIEGYASQLDGFNIELGVVGGGGQNIDYAIGFRGASPKKRSGVASEEKRLYFTWKQGSLMEADATLLEQAGIKAKGRIMMQFYPKEIENLLATLESAYAGNRDVRGIRRTVFGVRPKGAAFEYYVMDQTYRTFQQ